MEQWMNIRQLLIEESKYGIDFKTNEYKTMCDKYGFVQAANGWLKISGIGEIPNLANHIIHSDAPDIRDYFSNYYSFKDKNDNVYWVIAPKMSAIDRDQLMDKFRENRIVCDIMDGFYGDHAIIMSPKQLVNACNIYTIEHSKQDADKYALYQINIPMSINKEIRHFDTAKEAQAFKAGMDFAHHTMYGYLDPKLQF